MPPLVLFVALLAKIVVPHVYVLGLVKLLFGGSNPGTG